MFKLLISLAIIPLAIFSQEIKDSTDVPNDTTFIAVEDTASVQADSSFKKIEENFKTFKYNEVIRGAEDILDTDTALTGKQKIELYRMKAVSHFSLLEDQSAEKSIIEILKTDSAYTLDPINTSPKIISFFDSVRVEYFEKIRKQKDLREIDTIYIVQKIPDFSSEYKLKTAVFRSILLPGLGHLYSGDSFKGGVLTGLSAASLTAMIYLIIETEKKEDKYLTEKNRLLIPDLYNRYNKSYRLRNISIIFYSVLWFYTQIDLLFISDEDRTIPPIDLSFSGQAFQLYLNIQL